MHSSADREIGVERAFGDSPVSRGILARVVDVLPYGDIIISIWINSVMARKSEIMGLQTSFTPQSSVEQDPTREANPFALYLGFKRTDTAYVIHKISQGLSYSSFSRLLKEMSLSQQMLSDVVRIPASTLARRQQSGRLTPEESDRIARIAKVFSDAVELFEGDKTGARKWLLTPSRALGGETPLEYSQSELGAREVEKLIGRLEHGVFS